MAGYSITDRVIGMVQRPKQNNEGLFSTRDNLSKNETYTFNISAGLRPAKWWRTNTSSFIFFQKTTGLVNNTNLSRNLFTCRLFTNNAFTLSKKLTGEINFWYAPSALGGLNKRGPVGNLTAGIQKRIFQEKAVLRLLLTDIFRMQIVNMDADWGAVVMNTKVRFETRTIRLAFTYNFGNRNVRTARERNSGLAEEQERAENRN
jgi:hypothetical protein